MSEEQKTPDVVDLAQFRQDKKRQDMYQEHLEGRAFMLKDYSYDDEAIGVVMDPLTKEISVCVILDREGLTGLRMKKQAALDLAHALICSAVMPDPSIEEMEGD